ncbi:MFS transporter [Micromonospora mangrovi]|uniref:MFS transporter n=2 Tax=Micromonospora TaxID=1873 RepID=A0AAU8HIS2_9ACTN
MTRVESVPAGSMTAVPRGRWLAVAAVALGTFIVVTVENLPMGLLTAISGGLGVSNAKVGLLVTVSGLVAAVTAPLLPVAIRRADRRVVLLSLILLTVAANAVFAVSSSYPVIVVARLLIGVSIGGFWALAAGLGVRLVPPAAIPRATAVIFFGAMAANVVGVPLGTWLGELTSWRATFALVAALALLLTIVLGILLPAMPPDEPVLLRTLAAQLRTPEVRAGVVVTFLLVSGHYAAFTFISPILQDISGVTSAFLGPLLLAYGVCGLVGNFAGGAWAARNVRAAVVAISLALAASLALFPVVGRTVVGGSILLLIWGFAFGGLPVSVQTWIIKAAPQGIEAATGLNTFMFNLAIASGALFASAVAGAMSVTGVVLLAAGLVALTPVAVATARKQ